MSTQANNQLTAGQYYGSVVRRRRLDGLVLSELKHTSPRALPQHSHEFGFFSFLLKGDYREWYGRLIVKHQPQTLMWHPPALHHQDEVGARGCHFFNVEIPPHWLARLREHAALVADPFVLPEAEAGWLMVRLYREFNATPDEAALDDCSALALEGVLLELLAKLARRPGAVEQQKPRWLRRVEARLHDEFTEKLTMAELAAEAGVHSAHLAAVFRRFHHLTVGEYVQQLRVQTACELLRQPEAALAEIALQLGFADQSHLSRVFRRWTGMTPKAWRMNATIRGSLYE
jgi:AraC family transcriptional regulator